jgi:hypothetical protein
VLEEFHTFSSYVKWLGAQRCEGLLLRYLAEVFKTLSQGVPDSAKNDELFAFERDLETLVRTVDASLFDEWERLRSGDTARDAKGTPDGEDVESIARAQRAEVVRLRGDIWRRLMAVARDDSEAALERLVAEGPRSADPPAELMERLTAVRALPFATTAQARQPSLLHVDRSLEPWRVEQTLVDDDGEGLGVIRFEVDPQGLAATDAPFLRLVAVDA